MRDHGAREHAQWSASATDRNWNCAGALALTDDLPEQTNEAADWGTCAHQISEQCLNDGVQADEFIGKPIKGKKFEFEVDEEMAETAQTYVNYVRRRAIEAAPKNTNPASLLKVEQNFSLESLKPPFDAGGTADAVIYFPEEKLLEVIDLKGGRGVVVEATGNPQLRTYALGAFLANRDREVVKVMTTIVQPRAPHKDGKIRSDTFDVADLIEWTSDLLEAMQRSYHAVVDAGHNKRPDREVDWVAAYLNAGTHCKFCKAQGFCPAAEQKAMDTIGIWFDDLDQPKISNAPDRLSPEELSKRLDLLDMISDWCNAVRAYSQDQAESGVTIPNYVLVDKQGREKWTDADAEKKAAALAKKANVPDEKLFNPRKLRTPKQVRDAMSKAKADAKLFDDIKKLSQTPSTGRNLVRETKTTRPAVAGTVNKHFDILT